MIRIEIRRFCGIFTTNDSATVSSAISVPIHVLLNNEAKSLPRCYFKHVFSACSILLLWRQQRRERRLGEIFHGLDIGFRGTRVIPLSTICRTAFGRTPREKGRRETLRSSDFVLSSELQNGLHSAPCNRPT